MSQPICEVCGSIAERQDKHDPRSVVYSCPVCGRYEYYPVFSDFSKFNLNHLAPYLAYNGYIANQLEYRYFTTMSIEKCDEYKRGFEQGDTSHGHPVHLSIDNVENWYPKTFAEKVDYMLLYLNKHTPYAGATISFRAEQIYSWLFVDRYNYQNPTGVVLRDEEEMGAQAEFMIDYLANESLISVGPGVRHSVQTHTYMLLPKGYARVEQLQRNTANGRMVLVAMKFGTDTRDLREAIRKGISDANYSAVFIDEVEHIGLITPELLKHIRDSKFVVVDLSHQNNGAYFEEGYAMGLGKPVIQLCKKGVQLHFDIAQKNTIIWETESEIPKRLKNRIIATID